MNCRVGHGVGPDGTQVAIQGNEYLARSPVSPGLAGGTGLEVVRAGPPCGGPAQS